MQALHHHHLPLLLLLLLLLLLSLPVPTTSSFLTQLFDRSARPPSGYFEYEGVLLNPSTGREICKVHGYERRRSIDLSSPSWSNAVIHDARSPLTLPSPLVINSSSSSTRSSSSFHSSKRFYYHNTRRHL
jgi:hypothetical protein